MNRAVVCGTGGFIGSHLVKRVKKELIDTMAAIAGKTIKVRWIGGPVGVESRNFSNGKIFSLGWTSRFSLKAGIAMTYPWVAARVPAAQKG
jgi:GDP-D-mannose 3', 5'-epimerase